jgi:hypothetical protein
MSLGERFAAVTLLAALVVAVGPAPARAQLVVAGTERLDFDRPESWGMKYYASLALPTSVGAPQPRAAGEVVVGIEGGDVPQLNDAERRIGFNGTKLEDVNKTRLFGRVRASVSLGKSISVELAYTPPIETGGARPHIGALALEKPFLLSPSWRLGVRAYGLLGRLRADVTCSAGEVAAGDDPVRNPFRCVKPSKDESRQRVAGLEVVVGHDGRSRLEPYVGLGLSYMNLEFDVNAVYSGGRVEDHTVQLTSGTTVSAAAGLTYAAGTRLRVTGELFHSRLPIVRPAATAPVNQGFLNGRVFVAYRVR